MSFYALAAALFVIGVTGLLITLTVWAFIASTIVGFAVLFVVLSLVSAVALAALTGRDDKES